MRFKAGATETITHGVESTLVLFPFSSGAPILNASGKFLNTCPPFSNALWVEAIYSSLVGATLSVLTLNLPFW